MLFDRGLTVIVDCKQIPYRGYFAVTVSVLHGGALSFKPVQRSAQPGVAGMPIRRCTRLYFRVQARTDVCARDAPTPRFVMMGSGFESLLRHHNEMQSKIGLESTGVNSGATGRHTRVAAR